MKQRKKIYGNRRGRKRILKEITFKKVIDAARSGMKNSPNQNDAHMLTKYALHAARKEIKGKKIKNHSRILKVPTISGGFLPAAVIPYLTSLTTIGNLMGGIGGVMKAINEFRALKNSKSTTPIPLSTGKGLYIQPYKTGFGIIQKN